jgi:hypothetical protein
VQYVRPGPIKYKSCLDLKHLWVVLQARIRCEGQFFGQNGYKVSILEGSEKNRVWAICSYKFNILQALAPKWTKVISKSNHRVGKSFLSFARVV